MESYCRLFVTLFCSLILVGLPGCGSGDGTGQQKGTDQVADLQGTVWVLDNLDGDPLVADSRISLEFQAEGRVNGHGGCNSFGGSFTLTKGSLRFGPMMSTKMSCGPELDEQESRFLAALGLVRAARINTTDLILTVPDREYPLVFKADPEGQS